MKTKEGGRSERETIFNYLLAGMLMLAAIGLADNILTTTVEHEPFHPRRIINGGLMILLLIGLHSVAGHRRYFPRRREQDLESARLEQMSELYRFTELGRLSTALFHDLANHLSSICVDIEGLRGRSESATLSRMHDNVQHIDGVVQRVRRQIQGKGSVEIFNVRDKIDEIVGILSLDAAKADVRFIIRTGNVRPSLLYKGDLTRFLQIMLNLLSNAVEAYGPPGRGQAKRDVIVSLERAKNRLSISVTDHGSVIPRADRRKIFEPFYTTKPKGVGIGLFIVKRVVENDFKGAIIVRSDREHGTVFSINLPGSYYGRSRQHRS